MSPDSFQRQLSLNLAAIVVAMFTFSILLGPFLQIPQTIPALATITLLLLASIDQLAWQGQGVGLLLDSLAQLSPVYRQRVIHHEAGHFLAAALLDVPIQDYSLSAWSALRKGQPVQPGVSFAIPLAPAPHLSRPQLDTYATVWMAGIAAEFITYNDAEGGNQDRQKVAAIAQALTTDGLIYQRQSLQRAQTLLKENAQSLTDLVAAMQANASVSDCMQICTIQNGLAKNDLARNDLAEITQSE
jgi:hypothetical protein